MSQFEQRVPKMSAAEVDDDWLRHPEGPRAKEVDEKGRIKPGTSGNPSAMFRPGHSVQPWTHGPGKELYEAKQRSKMKREPFTEFELDYALAERLKERLDVPEGQAMDRLTLLARRVVQDALSGRPYAQEALLERLQPKRGSGREEMEFGGGVMIVTQVVGPQGVEYGARVHDVEAETDEPQ